MELDDLTTAEQVGIGGGVLAVIGAFLPWASFMGMSVNGLDGDGAITLILGAAAGAVILLREWEQVDQIGVGVLGLLTLGIGYMDYSDIDSLASGSQTSGLSLSISPGIGLYLTILGGILMLAAAALGYRDAQQPSRSTGNLSD